jgi:prefoldin beta subunit
MANEKIEQLQLLQQNLQHLSLQKQQIESQLSEVESALSEIKPGAKAYKIVGRIMISSSPESLSKDLGEKKKVLEVRLKNFTRQEERLHESLESLQKDMLAKKS